MAPRRGEGRLPCLRYRPPVPHLPRVRPADEPHMSAAEALEVPCPTTAPPALREASDPPDAVLADLRQPLAGLSVLVTGQVPGMTRSQAKAAVESLGGKPVGSVSRSTGLVVVGEEAGVSKIAKARALGLVGLLGSEFADLADRPERWHPARMRRVAVLDDLMDPAPEAVAPGSAPGSEDLAGEPGGSEGVAVVPLAERHLVGQTVVWPDGVREVRRLCQCGHRWLAGTPWEPLVCPTPQAAAEAAR